VEDKDTAEDITTITTRDGGVRAAIAMTAMAAVAIAAAEIGVADNGQIGRTASLGKPESQVSA
jgi:hypothetical protein